jgi:alkanesulfonate monooxygenase SsuD/methylene tetrahydromethanopterin reductase-like flavin-dependent oxidoreductase (luciferase family)
MTEALGSRAPQQGVEFGVYLPQLLLDFGQLLDRAQMAESLGIDSFWIFDHLYGPHLPTVDALEGWTLATALLTRTQRIHVGHLVLCTNFRHPALTAKMITSLDNISGGRFEVGLGSGSFEQEHHEAGLPWGSFAERSLRLEESLEIITQMLETGTATFTGTHFHVAEVPCLPRPFTQPRPRIHIGGVGPRYTLPLVARYADVWNVPTYAVGGAAESSVLLDRCCADIGRDPKSISRSIQAVLVMTESADDVDAALDMAERRYKGPGFGVREGGFIGTPPMIVARINELRAKGFDNFVFFFADRATDKSLKLFAEEVMQAV